MDRFYELVGELRKHKAEYLGHVLRLNEAYRSVDEVAVAYDQMAAKAGINERKLCHLPVINLTSTYQGKDRTLGVLENETLEAFRSGIVQPWVKLYLDHGILVESNMEAEDKYRELKGDN